MSPRKNVIKFLILCLVWGLTWIAVKTGIETVPPMMFAATRFLCAGLLLLGWSLRSRRISFAANRDFGRLVIASLLMITLCYGPLFWGMQFVASGTAAVIEMSLTPLALLGFGILLGEERWSGARALAMIIGMIGLSFLFSPSIEMTSLSGSAAIVGLLAISWSAVSSAWGSVLAKPLITRYGSTLVSGCTTLIGGAGLFLSSLAFEPEAAASLVTPWNWQAVAGWLFLVLFGSLIGYSIYLQLIRDIGPARAGSFAFVSPIVAVAVGVMMAGEALTAAGMFGMILMLLAAAMCLYGHQGSSKGSRSDDVAAADGFALRNRCRTSMR
ncbi:EamA family transporter [Rhizobium sp. CNPSo 3490]|uniref:DMT family transporter n=1 Tax=Rhizobium sp. CNPSo 3490 TaxID=3021407 RepID=UPI00254F3F2C|nr:EamA family transporter [Rhizobium sp. CNPSo 3490]MDK4731510.1 EamA family transporter [Rhizobium sp. CNPSo 3490]